MEQGQEKVIWARCTIVLVSIKFLLASTNFLHIHCLLLAFCINSSIDVIDVNDDRRWYRTHPDDFFLLEIATGAQSGQLTNIDETGAPSIYYHAYPHVQVGHSIK